MCRCSLYQPGTTVEVIKNSDEYRLLMSVTHQEEIGQGRESWIKVWSWKLKQQNGNKVTLFWG